MKNTVVEIPELKKRRDEKKNPQPPGPNRGLSIWQKISR